MTNKENNSIATFQQFDITYRDALHAIERAETIEEIKTIKDQAEILRYYAKRAKDKTLANRAAEIRIQSERKTGEIIQQLQARGELATRGDGPSIRDDISSHHGRRSTLADKGISYQESSRCQILNKVDKEVFDQTIENLKDSGAQLTSARVRAAVMKQVEQEQKKNIVPEPVKGTYSTIVIDPPWPITKIVRDVTPNQHGLDYPTMTVEEIERFSVVNEIARDDCWLFLWTTQRFLPSSFKILTAWDFKYLATMVWHKPGGFQPFGLPQYNCEFCLIGKRGKPEFTDLKNFNLCFSAPRTQHSAKPAEFYETIARVTPSPRIEVFSRHTRDGFDAYGNEKGKLDDVI